MTRDEIIEILSGVARKVLPVGCEAWLFGSQARGTAREDSDWDILVLIDKEQLAYTDYGIYAHPFMEKGWDIDATVIPLLFTKKQWEASSFTPFYKNVTKDRIVL